MIITTGFFMESSPFHYNIKMNVKKIVLYMLCAHGFFFIPILCLNLTINGSFVPSSSRIFKTTTSSTLTTSFSEKPGFYFPPQLFNVTRECLNPENVKRCTDDIVAILHSLFQQLGIWDLMNTAISLMSGYVTSLATKPSVLMFLSLLFVIYYFFGFLFLPLRILWCAVKCVVFKPCMKVVRIQQCFKGTSRNHGYDRMRIQAGGLENDDPSVISVGPPARAIGDGPTVAQPLMATNSTTAPEMKIDEPVTTVGEQVMSEQVAIAAAPQDNAQCNAVSNILFSGPMTRVSTWKRRKFPAYEKLKYGINAPEYTQMFLADTFVWKTTDTFGTVLYSKVVSGLIFSSSRFNFLKSLWSQYRFGVRIVIAPSFSSACNGSMIATLNPGGLFVSPVNTPVIFNHGLVPHGFMQAASNNHVQFDIPELGMDHWYTTSPYSFYSPWTLYVTCFHPLQSGAGAPTALSANIFVQLINIRARWPQINLVLTQGLLSGANTNITIEKMTDSTLPFNVTGDTNSLGITPFGMDHPSDTRNMTMMIRRIFQPIHYTKGKINSFAICGSPAAQEPKLFIGQDESSIPWIMSLPMIFNNFQYSATTPAYSRLMTATVPFANYNSETVFNSLIEWLVNAGFSYECNEIIFRFYIPKNPYLGGKLLAVYTMGIAPPTTINPANINCSGAPTLMIDLSTESLVHEFHVPWVTNFEYTPNGQVSGFSTPVPSISLYALTPLIASANSPSSINILFGFSFDGFRIVNPTVPSAYQVPLTEAGTNELSGGACSTNSCGINFESDKVFTKSVDELLSLKQYWMSPTILGSWQINNTGTSFTYEWIKLIDTIPTAMNYAIYTGSMRFTFDFYGWSGLDAVYIQFDKFTRDAAMGQTGADASWLGAVLNTPNTFVTNQLINTGLSNILQAGVSNYIGSGSLYNAVRVDSTEKTITLDIPMISPKGYIARRDIISQPGNCFTVVGVLAGGVSSGKVNMVIHIAAGDDFEGHYIFPNIQTIKLANRNGFGIIPNPY